MLGNLALLTEDTGFVMNSPAWQDDGMLKLYLYCLLKASRNAYEWRGIMLQPGDLPLSERRAAADLCWSRNKLDRKLKLLSESGLITVTSIQQKGTLVHVQNWPQNETDDSSVWYQDDAASNKNAGIRTKPQQFQNGTVFKPNWIQNDTEIDETGSMVEHNIYREKKRNNNIRPTINTPSEPEGFIKIWLSYPANRRNQREQAATLVAKALREGATLEAILVALEVDKCSEAWLTDGGKYIPGIVKWLQKETWHSYLRREPPKEDEEHWVSR